MIRHIVLFKFKDETPQNARDHFVAQLRALRHTVEVVRDLEVGINAVASLRACDVYLRVDVADLAALQVYAAHPQHQPVKALVSELCAASHVVDYPVG
jgi:hypothetical protein